MIVETVLFGNMTIPDTEDDIKSELERCRNRFQIVSTRYIQCRIDCLEEALDRYRSVTENVQNV